MENFRADHPLEQVVAEALYTDDNMFGDIKFDAELELFRRIPPPGWAQNKGRLPIAAQEFWNEDGTPKVKK